MRFDTGRKKILVVDDEEDILKILDTILSDAGFEVATYNTGRGVRDKMIEFMPELVLLDIMLPGKDGIWIKKQLNADPQLSSVPIIFLTAKKETDDVVKGLDLGADDYVTKPFNGEELVARIKAILGKKSFYEDMAMTDDLTGLPNSRFFQKEFSVTFTTAKRYDKVFSLAIVDINDFKKINDTYGHAAGDFVLKAFSSVAKDTLRESDMIARFGGDEFVIIMPETDFEQAVMAMDRLKKNVEDRSFMDEDINKELTFTISAGAATFTDSLADESQMFNMADSKLYEDKRRKRG
ncbi:MAG: diguanylate cyclase [Candidatus Tantalella remota]|nr:diguanylate cyclase [Candidatus Tantalella remota]